MGIAWAALAIAVNLAAGPPSPELPRARKFAALAVEDPRAAELAGDAFAIAGERETVMAEEDELLLLGFHDPSLRLVGLPSNWREEGVLDAFIERFSVRWVRTEDPAAVGGTLKTHLLKERRAPRGALLFEVLPKIPG
jgi:hypothetical protein